MVKKFDIWQYLGERERERESSVVVVVEAHNVDIYYDVDGYDYNIVFVVDIYDIVQQLIVQQPNYQSQIIHYFLARRFTFVVEDLNIVKN